MSQRYTPLPSRAKRALEQVSPLIRQSTTCITRADARATLSKSEFEESEVDGLLDILIQRGYLYTVNGELRATGSIPPSTE